MVPVLSDLRVERTLPHMRTPSRISEHQKCSFLPDSMPSAIRATIRPRAVIMAALVDFSDQITKIYRQDASMAQPAFEQPRGGRYTF